VAGLVPRKFEAAYPFVPARCRTGTEKPSGKSQGNSFHFTLDRTRAKREIDAIYFIFSSFAVALSRIGRPGLKIP
jgi:hypothetical protein